MIKKFNQLITEIILIAALLAAITFSIFIVLKYHDQLVNRLTTPPIELRR